MAKITLFITAVLFTAAFPSNIVSADEIQLEEIEKLIVAVETSQCVFHRNGDAHKAEDAADHLRLKLRRGKRYAKTTEDFIKNLASYSSWSGKAYLIECNNTDTEEMDVWLNNQLAVIRALR